MIVVKVGGSLFDHPALGAGLRAYVTSLAPKGVLLVPGGGPVADAVRELDRVHALGEEASHWLALRSLGVTAALLSHLLGEPGALLNSPLEGEVAGTDFGSGGWGVRHPESLPPTRRVRSDAATSPSRGEVKAAARVRALDPFVFATEDESRPGALPHSWSVTTDSIAARVAVVHRAERLVLLKSVDVPAGTSWPEAAANGWVDAHFPQIAPMLDCPVEVVNFRRQLTRVGDSLRE